MLEMGEETVDKKLNKKSEVDDDDDWLDKEVEDGKLDEE
jgi:hypothetical protein